MTEVEIKRNFARNIKELRLSRKINQVQLGEKIHYSSKAISKWENEDVLPDITTLKMLADFFNITVDDLISNKNVVRKSHRALNRVLITFSACFISFFVAAIVFLILYYAKVSGSWKAFIVALVPASITFTVFAGLWFKRITLNIAVSSIVWSASLTTMAFMDFYYFWVIIIVAIILNMGLAFFFNIRFSHAKGALNED